MSQTVQSLIKTTHTNEGQEAPSDFVCSTELDDLQSITAI